jgi:sugar phosphate permease
MYLITYLDRVNISTAAPEISKEFGFDKITMGVIFSAFVWAYAMFQVRAAGSAIGLVRAMS